MVECFPHTFSPFIIYQTGQKVHTQNAKRLPCAAGEKASPQGEGQASSSQKAKNREEILPACGCFVSKTIYVIAGNHQTMPNTSWKDTNPSPALSE